MSMRSEFIVFFIMICFLKESVVMLECFLLFTQNNTSEIFSLVYSARCLMDILTDNMIISGGLFCEGLCLQFLLWSSVNFVDE